MIDKQKMGGKDFRTGTYLYQVRDDQIVGYFLFICVGEYFSLSSNISSSFACFSICSFTEVERHFRVHSQEIFEISPVHMCSAVSVYKSVNHIVIYYSFKLSILKKILVLSRPLKLFVHHTVKVMLIFLVILWENNALL